MPTVWSQHFEVEPVGLVGRTRGDDESHVHSRVTIESDWPSPVSMGIVELACLGHTAIRLWEGAVVGQLAEKALVLKFCTGCQVWKLRSQSRCVLPTNK